MECTVTDEVIGTGEEGVMDSWSWEVLTSLYGEIDLPEFVEDDLLDYTVTVTEDTPPS